MLELKNYMRQLVIVLTILSGLLTYCNKTIQNPEVYKEYQYRIPEQLDDGWETATMKNTGIDTIMFQTLMNKIIWGDYDYLHSILVVKNGKLVFEEYVNGFKRTNVNQISTITKTFLGALTGIAVDKGLVNNVNDPVMNYLPEYAGLRDEDKNKVLIRHLLTMTAGFQWNQLESVTSSESDLNLAVDSGDYIHYVLSKPIIDEPGTKWYLNDGYPEILGGIIKSSTDTETDKFAEEYLFNPLGFEGYFWDTYSNGMLSCAWGLSLVSRDLAKFGYLFLTGGRWNGNQVISEDWINESIKPYIATDINHIPWWIGSEFGFQWNMKRMHGYDLVYATGNGGQFLICIPELDIVVVTTAVNDSAKMELMWEIVENYIVGAF